MSLEGPAIPILKKEERKERRAGLAAFGVSSPGEGEGFLSALARALGSNARLALLTVGVCAPAAVTLHAVWRVWSVRSQAGARWPRAKAAAAPAAKVSPDAPESSLDLLARANAGAGADGALARELRDAPLAAHAAAAPPSARAAAAPGFSAGGGGSGAAFSRAAPAAPAAAERPPLPAPVAAAAGVEAAPPPGAGAAPPAPSRALPAGAPKPEAAGGRSFAAPLRGNRAPRGDLLGRKLDPDKAVAKNSLGQLRFADQKSLKALKAPAPESTARTANDAFELGRTNPGGGLLLRGLGRPTPDLESHEDEALKSHPVPPAGTQANDTPYQRLLDSARRMLDQAVVAKSTGITLITTGIILVIIGRIMGPFGWPLVLAGMATIALGWSFIMLGRRLRRSAYDIGTVIKEQYGQKDEGTIVQQCVKQAKALITAEDCDPADKPRIQRGDVEGDEDVFERIGRMPGGGDAFTAATNVDVPAGPDP